MPTKCFLRKLLIVCILLVVLIYVLHVYRSASSITLNLERIWEHDTTGGVSGICISPDGKVICSSSGINIDDESSFDKGEVRAWDLKTGKLIQTVYEGTDPAWAVALSKDGNLLACSIGNRVKQWRLQHGIFKPDIQLAKWATAVEYSPDGSLLASRANNDIFVWNTKSGNLKWRTHEPRIGSNENSARKRYSEHIKSDIDMWRWLHFSPDGKSLVAPAYVWNGEHSYSKITLWDPITGRSQHTDRLYGIVKDSACYSHSGSMLAIGGSGQVRLLDSKDLHLKATIDWEQTMREEHNKGHVKTYDGMEFSTTGNIAFSPDDEVMSIGVTGGQDAVVDMRNLKTGELIGYIGVIAPEYTHGSRNSVAFSPDGSELAVMAFGKIVLYRLPEKLIR